VKETCGIGLTVRFKVANESHPEDEVNVRVVVPEIESDCPFQLYGAWFAQIVTLVVLVSTGIKVRFNTVTESHP
jgi:hypothetical protein